MFLERYQILLPESDVGTIFNPTGTLMHLDPGYKCFRRGMSVDDCAQSYTEDNLFLICFLCVFGANRDSKFLLQNNVSHFYTVLYGQRDCCGTNQDHSLLSWMACG